MGISKLGQDLASSRAHRGIDLASRLRHDGVTDQQRAGIADRSGSTPRDDGKQHRNKQGDEKGRGTTHDRTYPEAPPTMRPRQLDVLLVDQGLSGRAWGRPSIVTSTRSS